MNRYRIDVLLRDGAQHTFLTDLTLSYAENIRWALFLMQPNRDYLVVPQTSQSRPGPDTADVTLVPELPPRRRARDNTTLGLRPRRDSRGIGTLQRAPDEPLRPVAGAAVS